MRRTARRLTTLAVVFVLGVCVACVLPLWWALVRPVPPTPVDGDRVARARDAVGDLRVTEPLPLEDYRREFFGEPWYDVDGNGCDTRNDVLAAWLTDLTRDPTRPCLVTAGTLRDPYTGDVLTFRRGPGTSADVQIDHVVALADAWRKGASSWTRRQALAFANDPANLVPTGAEPNQDKSAADAATWLPPNRGYHCAYAVQQVLVKAAYGLGVTGEEYAALAGVLADCPRSDPGEPMSVPTDSLAAPQIGHLQRAVTTGGGRVLARRCRRLLRHRSHGGPDLRVRSAASARRGPRPGRAARGRRPGPRPRGSPGG